MSEAADQSHKDDKPKDKKADALSKEEELSEEDQ